MSLQVGTLLHGPSKKDQYMRNGEFQESRVLMLGLNLKAATILNKFLVQSDSLFLLLLLLPVCVVFVTGRVLAAGVRSSSIGGSAGDQCGEIGIVSDLDGLSQFPKSPPIIVGWKEFQHGRACLEKHKIGRGGTVRSKDDGVAMPPGKLLHRCHLFHVDGVHHCTRKFLSNGSYQFGKVQNASRLEPVHYSNAKYGRFVVVGGVGVAR